jgi:hypothetical protein
MNLAVTVAGCLSGRRTIGVNNDAAAIGGAGIA